MMKYNSAEAGHLKESRVLVVAGTSAVGRQIAMDAARAGAEVIVTADTLSAAADVVTDLRGRCAGKLAPARLDLSDEASITELAWDVGDIDHVVLVTSAVMNPSLTGARHDDGVAVTDASVIGSLLLAKHFISRITAGGSVLVMSEIAAGHPRPPKAAAIDGAVRFLGRALSVELAPVRVNVLCLEIPGSAAANSSCLDEAVTAWPETLARNLTGGVRQVEDVAEAALELLMSPHLMASRTLSDGGGRLDSVAGLSGSHRHLGDGVDRLSSEGDTRPPADLAVWVYRLAPVAVGPPARG